MGLLLRLAMRPLIMAVQPFRRDYWQMEDVELWKLACRYNLPGYTWLDDLATPDGSGGRFELRGAKERDRIIKALVERDSARRARWTMIISISALLISLTSLILTLFRK